MKSSTLFFTTLCSVLVTLSACSQSNENKPFNAKAAWLELEDVIKQDYAYLDRASFNVESAFDTFEKQALNTTNKKAFIDVGQRLTRYFSDPHLNLGPYDEFDFSVFPTGSDIRAVYLNKKFIIEDVKADSAADKAALRPGSEVITIDGFPAKTAIENVFGQPFESLSLTQVNYGLNIALGGLRNKERLLTIATDGEEQDYALAASYEAINQLNDGPTLTYKKIGDLGYIRFNNSLGNAETVSEFANAITELMSTEGLIIDLRNTPSGGNTGVAEPILGHFVSSKTPYQRYQKQNPETDYQAADMQTAYAEPSTPFYAKPFVVIAGRWTGSMGEGMTIGLDAIGAKTVVGAPMADLLGGIKTVQLSHSGAWLEIAFERLYHVDGTFREDFKPHELVIPADRSADGGDPSLKHAVEILETN
ncbi:S41 family peptidase [Thalassotalea euphylliae]|uniref:S41 family peptidase n=1 Tax=Thalassotalea euphylliae TaxID=1655234 RepID=UPI0036387966